ncbi:AMP-binding protein [Frankia sp. CNm7]|uniref:AMP-binding protein n=1 Tax=Frankia nepalensis TaxID=1836974 RepID=A0A937USB6_9ACTN|nr:AMP-binding protein [Frankia nepalensis]MBL7495059.1 AMP-binding protein [Frankia nepalensis]MBL7515239.1 AMP-binding protein [Frankia nepalensis]MBL7522183.1 AMP-binding protein [Frankia nepalensis]MBL7632297.1 AMP-binding protein [Frankia nepalensis]
MTGNDGLATAEWSLPAVLDVITATVPDREMLVWTDVHRTYAEVRERTRRLAAFLRRRGLGARRERAELERWECGQSPVAILLSNCPEYPETMIGAYRARAVPFNVNHHYTPHEVAALLDQIGAEAVVYHRRLGPLLAAGGTDLGRLLLVDVDDGSGVAPLPGSTPYETALAEATEADLAALPVPSPDDLFLVCTGGTTGKPKGVLWRQADVYVAAMGGLEGATAERIAAVAAAAGAGRGPGGSGVGRGGVWFAAPPLMHGAAQWTAFAGLALGATLVLHDDSRPFDAREILTVAAREGVTMMTIVGDAYARPLVEELRRASYDLSALTSLSTGGATTSAAHKQALLELLPHLTIIDGYGASETGGMAFGASTKNAATRQFTLSAGGAVLSMDRRRFLRPDEDETGWTARVGRVPLGYLNDPAKTAATFPVIDGQRVTVPGDRAHYDPDGSGRIVMLGRDSMVVNTGGEKVFVEEVEEALRRHPDILDALVVGRPSERFGEEVVALVAVREGAVLSPGDVRAFAASSLARFKAPRAVLLCEKIGRHPTGKADYTWARRAAVDAVAAV